MGKRRRRRAVIVVEELDEPRPQACTPLPQQQQKRPRLPLQPLGAQDSVRRQAAQFLSQLTVADDLGCRLGECKAGGVACNAHSGATHDLCTRCGHTATVHELEIEAPRPVGLGQSARLLLRARAAITQLGSFAWSNALIRAAQAGAPEALGFSDSGMLLDAVQHDDFSALQLFLEGGGAPSAGSEAVQHSSSREVARWWRQHSATNGLVIDGEGLESVVRLACEIDALWFRLYYYTATEAPEQLIGKSPASGMHGVPTHGEWVARAVGATVESSLLGGGDQQSRKILTQAAALGGGYAYAAGRAGRSTDIDGLELSAVLRRGLAAAQLGCQATLDSCFSSSSSHRNGSGSSPVNLDNELHQVYDCYLVESQLLFQHNKMLHARMAQQWSRLAREPHSLAAEDLDSTGLTQAHQDQNATAPPAKAARTAAMTKCVVCANQDDCSTQSGCCSFCNRTACIDTCAAECPSCGEIVCLRCRYQDEVCPRCDFPLCPPLLSLYRDSCRDPACHLMAYAVPSDAALSAVVDLQLPVIECGAGTGYWAKLLRARGVVVAAYDIAASKTAEELATERERFSADGVEIAGEGSLVGNEYHAEIPAFTTVWQGGAEAACGEVGASTGTRAPGFDPLDAALFLCFPPPVSRMASDCLRAYRGSVLLYVGEWQGETGTPKFEKRLCKDWVLCRRIPLPNWGSTSYTLTIWLRKRSVRNMVVRKSKARSSTGKAVAQSGNMGSIPRHLLAGLDLTAVGDEDGTMLLAPMPCATCGNPAKRRCRFCHAVAYCSARCCSDGAPAHRRSHRMRGVFLPSLPKLGHANGKEVAEHADEDGKERKQNGRELCEGAYGSEQQYAQLERFVQRS